MQTALKIVVFTIRDSAFCVQSFCYIIGAVEMISAMDLVDSLRFKRNVRDVTSTVFPILR